MIDTNYMIKAINTAKEAALLGEVPVGAVVVQNPIEGKFKEQLINSTEKARVVAICGNKREQNNDPSAHAEVLAIKQAAQKLGRWRLTDCTVYVTLEPCIMCAGLMHQARVAKCVYGAPDPKAGALGSLYEIHKDNRLNHTFQVESGVLQDECAQLLRDFFKSRR